MQLDHSLERTVFITARRDLIFRFLSDSSRFEQWFGPGSTIDPKPGGAVTVKFPGNVAVSGQVIEVTEGDLISFTWGYDAPGKPIPPGGSRITVRLRAMSGGTFVDLRHEVADAKTRDEHVQGWRYHLSLLANAVTREAHAAAATRADRWFDAWAERDAARRTSLFAEIATPDVVFHDSFSALQGIEDLVQHSGATQVHMPDMKISRDGEAEQCQGTAVVSWAAKAADGTVKGRGKNVFDFNPDGKITRVVGLWAR